MFLNWSYSSLWIMESPTQNYLASPALGPIWDHTVLPATRHTAGEHALP